MVQHTPFMFDMYLPCLESVSKHFTEPWLCCRWGKTPAKWHPGNDKNQSNNDIFPNIRPAKL